MKENVYYNPLRDSIHVGTRTLVVLLETTVEKATKENLKLLKSTGLCLEKAKPQDKLTIKLVLDDNWVKIGTL